MEAGSKRGWKRKEGRERQIWVGRRPLTRVGPSLGRSVGPNLKRESVRERELGISEGWIDRSRHYTRDGRKALLDIGLKKENGIRKKRSLQRRFLTRLTSLALFFSRYPQLLPKNRYYLFPLSSSFSPADPRTPKSDPSSFSLDLFPPLANFVNLFFLSLRSRILATAGLFLASTRSAHAFFPFKQV